MSKRGDFQKKIGDLLFDELKKSGWEKDLGNPEIYGLRKKNGANTWGVSFNLSGREEYSIYSSQDVSYNEYSAILKSKLDSIFTQDDPLIVGIVSRNIDFSSFKLTVESDVKLLIDFFRDKIKETESIFYEPYSDESNVVKKNMSSFHWKWPSQPYMQFVLFMIGYAIKNNDLSKIEFAYEKVKLLKDKFQPRPGEMDKVNSIFNELVKLGLMK
ncbi:hypothetical protein HNP33_002897 [Comamonas odontotermitis]|uniref:DUF4304 domain-containing protein n=1 Tax=Comamonas odontotermitis TaxID=379895 RepID=A0ABR6RI01_9BURK|nr:hypothetical protein [Comamonas odontotermitis]MBB6578795.1 hypothetical protein [Comamonas odontotermitis]